MQVVIDIDGDGSFMMNCQELATAAIEELDVKMVILNNQHLGMVVQWEDRFYKANRAHTYLGRRVSAQHQSCGREYRCVLLPVASGNMGTGQFQAHACFGVQYIDRELQLPNARDASAGQKRVISTRMHAF